GGAVQIVISGHASGAQLGIAQSSMTYNTATGGAGGGGGTGNFGGSGGAGGRGTGGGLLLDSFFPSEAAASPYAWTLDSDTVAYNQATGGAGGAGAGGLLTGGNGGNGADADGGGIIDQFGGTL